MKGFMLGICLTVLASAVMANAGSIPFSMTHASQKRIKDDPVPPVPPAPAPGPAPAPVPPQPVEQPYLNLPPQIEGDAGSFIKVAADTNGMHVRWVSVDKGLAVFPGEMLKDSTTTVVMATAPGQYRLWAYTALNDVPTDPVMTLIVIHGAQPPPAPPQPPPQPAPPVPPVPPPAPPPAPPAPATAAKLWITVLDNAVSRSPQAAAILTDINLRNALQAQGHTLEEVNLSMRRAQDFKEQVTKLGGVPCVVIMDASKAKGNWLNQNPQDMRLPDSAAGFQALISKYAGH